MVKWKRKGDFLSMANKAFLGKSRPKKKFKPKKIPKPIIPRIPKMQKTTMKMVEVEPELRYKKGFRLKETGIYKQKGRWF